MPKLVGKKIEAVKIKEGGKAVTIILEDNTELIVEMHGHPGIHYEMDESLRVVVNGHLYLGEG